MPGELKGRTVLVVDTSRTTRQLICNTVRVLTGASEFIEAADGPAAIKVMRDRHADIAYVNTTLDVLSGIDVLRHFRGFDGERQGHKAMMPVIMYGDGRMGDVIECMRAGAHTYIALPFTSRILVGRAITLMTKPLDFARRPDGLGPGRDFFGPMTPWAVKEMLKDGTYTVVGSGIDAAALPDEGDDIDMLFAEMGKSQRVTG